LVIKTLSERADGMFRWAFRQLEALRYCFPPSVRQMLEELPETLDEAYERMSRNIHKTNRDHAHRLLQCFTVAVRPLQVTEHAEVLAIDFGTATPATGGISKLNPKWWWEDQQQAVLSTCSSLISVVDQEGTQVRGHSKQTLVLDCSALYGHLGVAEWLLHRGADPNIKYRRQRRGSLRVTLAITRLMGAQRSNIGLKGEGPGQTSTNFYPAKRSLRRSSEFLTRRIFLASPSLFLQKLC